jgi:hypothetical protein
MQIPASKVVDLVATSIKSHVAEYEAPSTPAASQQQSLANAIGEAQTLVTLLQAEAKQPAHK